MSDDLAIDKRAVRRSFEQAAAHYDAAAVLPNGEFDLVFTGIGALCWLPSVGRWAEVVEKLLKPGGRLFIREGHPMMWALTDPLPEGRLELEYPYFEHENLPCWSDREWEFFSAL